MTPNRPNRGPLPLGRRSVLLAACLAFLLGGCGTAESAPTGEAANPTPQPQIQLLPLGGAPIPVVVEVVATPALRQRGLMFREELPGGHGMLFLFPASAPLSFWMKNTLIPLDILFIEKSGRIVRIHQNTTPHSEAPLASDAPARFVLEVPGGWTAQVGIREGDLADLGPLATHPAT
jgi:uncharacterized membrane protein (UPF0127 family)